MANQVETDITVQRFGFMGDEAGRRLRFPRAESHQVEGRSGTVGYGAADCVFDDLEGRLDTLRWTAEAASVGKAAVRLLGRRPSGARPSVGPAWAHASRLNAGGKNTDGAYGSSRTFCGSKRCPRSGWCGPSTR